MSCESPPHPDDQDELATDSQENPVAALIDQMTRNWDHGNNAANDDLVVRIREHIRQQQTTTALLSDDHRETTRSDTSLEQ
ncbi:MAG: hypothetical protein ACRDSP_25005 [Pseudonocardiaceae bacterium]